MKILFVGDSFTEGAELEYPGKNRFSKIVSDHYQTPEINISRSGAANDEIFLRLIEYLLENEKPDVCVVQLTDIYRVTIPHKEGYNNLNPNSHFNPTKGKIAELIFRNSAENMLSWYNLTRYKLTLIQSFLHKIGVKPVICIKGDHRINQINMFLKDTTLFDKRSIFIKETLQQMMGNNRKRYGHPDEVGHKIIADKIIKTINEEILFR